METALSFNSDNLYFRILKMIYAAGYSEVQGDEEWRKYAFEEFNRLASIGDFLPRTFNSGGRLLLCFAFKWLVSKGIVEDSNKLGERINRFFYRQDIIWDCSPDMISSIDNDIDGESVAMLSLFSECDTLERYALQEKMIAHLNELDRLLSGNCEFVNLKSIHPAMLCSMLHFVVKCDEKKIYPVRTSSLTERIHELWIGLDKERWQEIIFEHISLHNLVPENLTEQMHQAARAHEKAAMFLFLHNMSDKYGVITTHKLPSPDKINGEWGSWCCILDGILNDKRILQE